ncbi:hypothetical protein LLEC1_06859 [Akanthomyces lecanii]|uniref:Carbohydrate kinase PfkB domain-containing protein n=1 Tax=Cordyceps confragosa TaxID=2714763 RepID=A0A179IK29_CORDF|nr:hypothetical protein LLEC1_06859 [Akanthomyces lecanii]
MDIVMVGACYLDTILTVPHYPEEDTKLRASNLEIRRGGNCPNSLEVLQQLTVRQDDDSGARQSCPRSRLHLVACLPRQDSRATQQVVQSFGKDTTISFKHCIYREEATEAASSYIIRSKETGSRTLVNYNALDEMTVAEFEAIARDFKGEGRSWWHFEGRIPETTLECVRVLRRLLPGAKISVEVEKPGRKGLRELAAEADVVFYSKVWAEIHCPVEQQPDEIIVVDSVGAGDTFVAGMLYGLTAGGDERAPWDAHRCVRFAVDLATLKVQREGFAGLGDDVLHSSMRRPVTRT